MQELATLRLYSRFAQFDVGIRQSVPHASLDCLVPRIFFAFSPDTYLLLTKYRFFHFRTFAIHL